MNLTCVIVTTFSVRCLRFVQSKSNSKRQLLEFILQLQIFEQVITASPFHRKASFPMHRRKVAFYHAI